LGHEGGFEYAFLILALAFVISALGLGSYSITAWASVPNWAGLSWPCRTLPAPRL
jgi:hypothetical protein